MTKKSCQKMSCLRKPVQHAAGSAKNDKAMTVR